EARERLIAAGVAAADIVTERSADMRLEGQMHEINVPLPDGVPGLDPGITTASLPAIRAAFATAYAARYTSVYGGVGVQAISFRVRCRGPMPALSLTEAGARASGTARRRTRPAWCGNGFVETPVYDGYALPGDPRTGRPASTGEREDR